MFNIIGTTIYSYNNQCYIFEDDTKIISNMKNNLLRISETINYDTTFPFFKPIGKIEKVSSFIEGSYNISAKPEHIIQPSKDYKSKELYFKDLAIIYHLDTNIHIKTYQESYNKIDYINNTKYIKFTPLILKDNVAITEIYHDIPFCYVERCDIHEFHVIMNVLFDMPIISDMQLYYLNNIFENYNSISKTFDYEQYINDSFKQNICYVIKDYLKVYFANINKIQNIILENLYV